jgi:hypothetical protein
MASTVRDSVTDRAEEAPSSGKSRTRGRGSGGGSSGSAGAGGTTTGETRSLQDVVRWLAATALVGAGIIHFAYAPVHLDEELTHGLFFLVSGWLQLLLAAALVMRSRPERTWLAVIAVVNAAVIGVWVVSRTTGVPGSEAESVGFPDVTATVLEAVATLAAVALFVGLVANRPLRVGAGLGSVGVGAIATIAVVSMAVSPSFAGEHSHGGEAGGHSHGGDEAAGGAGHGHGAMDMDPEEWAQLRYDSLAGYAPPEVVEEFKAAEHEYLSEQIRTRSDLLRTLPEDEAEARIDEYSDWAVENTISLLEGAQSNGPAGEGMHSHGPTTWQPITSAEDQQELQAQLEEAGTVIEQFPDVAAAEAGGYRQISPYVPGIGAHWINGNFDGEFEAAKPEMLLFNGTEQDSELIGLSYAAISDEPPEGFVGPNDQWHAHPGLCMLGGLVIGIDGTPEELCESVGGEIAAGLANLQMMHLWQVPGWESEWGLFSAENPDINVATSDLGREIMAGGSDR